MRLVCEVAVVGEERGGQERRGNERRGDEMK
jgi:hypothetical protein